MKIESELLERLKSGIPDDLSENLDGILRDIMNAAYMAGYADGIKRVQYDVYETFKREIEDV